MRAERATRNISEQAVPAQGTEQSLFSSSFARHGLLYWLGRMGSRTVSIFLLPIYTAFIAPAQWGVLNILMITSDMVVLAVSFQLCSAFYRYWAFTPGEEEKRRLFGLLLSSSALLSGVLLLPVYIWPQWTRRALGVDIPNSYIWFLTVTMQLSVLFGAIQAELRLRNKARLYAALDMGRNLCMAIINIFLVAELGLGIKGILIGQFITFALIVAALLPYSLRRATLNLDTAVIRKLLFFSLPLIPSALAMAAVNNIDRFFLQSMLGPAAVGIYSMGYKFGTLVSLLVLGPFALIWEPKSYEIAKRTDAPEKIGEIFSLLMFFLLWVAIGLTGASREIVHIMTARGYWNALRVIPVVSFSYVFFGMDTIVKTGLMVHKKTKAVLFVVLAACASNIAANLLLIPRMGMQGAAWATLIAFAVLFFLDMSLGRRYLPIRFEWGKLSLLFLAGCLALAGMHMVRDVGLLPAMALKFVILAVMTGMLFMLGFFKMGKHWARSSNGF